MNYVLSHLWYLSLTTVIVCAAIASVLATFWLLTAWLKSARASDVFKTLCALLVLPGIILLCITGAVAGLIGATRLDAWCARQITDTDGQPEK